MATKGGFNLDLLTLVINATADPVVEALDDASNSVQSFISNFVGIGVPIAAAFAGVEASISGIKGIIEGVTASVVGFNDSMFDYSVQLKKVMDDNIETAQGRLLQIQDIARNVDFGVENLATAARTLRDLGGSALDTDENLKLFADTASATGNKVETVATVMGRLYGVVQEGQPIGRLSLQLQRMGIVSAETIEHVQRMQKAGVDANTVWQEITESLQKFVPAAEESVGSVESFSAMIQKNLNIWNANAFRPLYEGFRDLFHVISDGVASDQFQQWGYNVRAVMQIAMDGFRQITPNVETAGNAISSFVEGTGNILIGLINTAAQWGAGLMEAYAEGLAQGVNLIIGIIEGLANLISYWIAPHSPPKFLPFIDKWGIETANLYVQGFSKASMDPINELSKQLEDELRNAFRFKGGFDLEDAIMNMRVGIVEAMHDIQETGRITDETWQKIHESMGPVGSDVDNIVDAYLDLASAQEQVRQTTQALKDLQDEYNDALRPIDREIDKLQTQERIMRAQAELGKAMENQAKGKDPGGVGVAEAQLKMQILQAQIKKDQLKLEHQDALDAAQDADRAARSRVDADKREIDSIKDKSKWMQDNIRLWDEFNKPPSGGGGKGGGSSGILDNFTSGLEGARKRIEEEKKKIQDALDDLGKKLKPAEDAFTSMLGPVLKIATSLGTMREEIEKIKRAWEDVPEQNRADKEFGGDVGANAGGAPPDINPWTKFTDDVKASIASIPGFFEPVNEAWDNVVKRFNTAKTNWGDIINIADARGYFDDIKVAADTTFKLIKDMWDLMWVTIRDITVIALDTISGDLDKGEKDMAKLFDDLGHGIEKMWKDLWEGAVKDFENFKKNIKPIIDTIQNWFNSLKPPDWTPPWQKGGAPPPGSGGKDSNALGPDSGGSPPAPPSGKDGNALGTDYWRGGLTLVGEEGPELVNLPSASKVFNNADTRRALNNMIGAKTLTHSPTYIINGGDRAEIERTIAMAERRTLEKFRDVLGTELEAV